MSCCRLETERLLLRPQGADDIPAIVSLLNDFDVSKNLANVPYPYTEEHGHAFLARGADDRARGQAYPFTITLRQDGTPIGGCGLRLKDDGFFDLLLIGRSDERRLIQPHAHGSSGILIRCGGRNGARLL